MAVLWNWMFGGREELFCVQQTLTSFWVLHLLNKGRMMGTCRQTGPQGIIWIESKGVWGREETRHVFLTVKPRLKEIYCFVVNKGLPSTWATYTFFFHLKILFGIWGLWWFLSVLNIWESWRRGALRRWCARAVDVAWPPTPPDLLCSEHRDVLLPRMSSWEMLQLRSTNLNSHVCHVSNFRIPASWQNLPISSAKIWLKAACIYGKLCARIPSLSRGVMSLSLILALWKEQMVPRSRTSEPELQFGASCSVSISSGVSQAPSSLHLPLEAGWERQLNELVCWTRTTRWMIILSVSADWWGTATFPASLLLMAYVAFTDKNL